MMYKLFKIISILALLILAPVSLQADTLYQELGKAECITKFVTKAVELYHSDERLAFLFEDVNDEYLIEQLEDHMCNLSGGPCNYEGLDMVSAHSGLEITKAEFDIFVEIFIDALEYAEIPHSTRYKLLALLAPMRKDIIHQ